jgi:hypothetical protein
MPGMRAPGERPGMNETITPGIIYEKPLSAKVEALAGYGISPTDIATVLAVDEQDLKATYTSELENS